MSREVCGQLHSSSEAVMDFTARANMVNEIFDFRSHFLISRVAVDQKGKQVTHERHIILERQFELRRFLFALPPTELIAVRDEVRLAQQRWDQQKVYDNWHWRL